MFLYSAMEIVHLILKNNRTLAASMPAELFYEAAEDKSSKVQLCSLVLVSDVYFFLSKRINTTQGAQCRQTSPDPKYVSYWCRSIFTPVAGWPWSGKDTSETDRLLFILCRRAGLTKQAQGNNPCSRGEPKGSPAGTGTIRQITWTQWTVAGY